MGTVSLLNLSAFSHLFPQCYITWWGGEGSCMGLEELSLLRSQSLGLVGAPGTEGSRVRACWRPSLPGHPADVIHPCSPPRPLAVLGWGMHPSARGTKESLPQPWLSRMLPAGLRRWAAGLLPCHQGWFLRHQLLRHQAQSWWQVA